MGFVRALIIKYVVPQYRIITFAGFFAGCLTLSVFHQFDRAVELEEHGLISGHFHSEFGKSWSHVLSQTLAAISTKVDVADALNSTLSGLSHPLYEIPYSTQWVNGSNFYTVVQSSRGDSREALVLVVSTNAWTAVKPSAMGLAVGLTLVQFLRQVKWLSRDVLVIFCDGTVPYAQNIRSFLETYTSGSAPMVRRGVLRQAIVVEIGNDCNVVHLDIDGTNGMLPNQDIVNAFMIEAGELALDIRVPKPWTSVRNRFLNGGVHRAHSAFLDYQVPAFTVRCKAGRSEGKSNPTSVLIAVEGLLHNLSNVLQQMHHSFNAYFYNTRNSHVSTGIYLYPLFCMQAPLASYLALTPPLIDDTRSLLAGLASVFALIAFCGGVPFLLATNSVVAGILGTRVPSCDHVWDETARASARLWVLSAIGSSVVCAWILRRWAWSVWEGSSTRSKFTIPYPLWNTLTCASGLVFGLLLAPLTMYNWAMAVPLTVLVVPILLLLTPWSIHRPVRTAVVALFLLGHLVPFLGLDCGIVQNALTQLDDQAKTMANWSRIPRPLAPYLPTHLISFLCGSKGLISILRGDPLMLLYQWVEEYRCVSGMFFPLLCFLYVPFLSVVFIVSLMLPAQKVDPLRVSAWKSVVYSVSVVTIVVVAFAGGVIWRSYSSAGMGSIKW